MTARVQRRGLLIQGFSRRAARPGSSPTSHSVPVQHRAVVHAFGTLSRHVPRLGFQLEPEPPIAVEAHNAVRSFVCWLDAFGEWSQDPYDFWASVGGHAKTLYYRRRLLGKLATAPFVMLDMVAPWTRALVRPRARFPIADAHYAMGFFALARTEDDPRSHIRRGRAFLDALERSRSPLFEDPAWGYPFDWPTRYGVWRAGWPMITCTPYGYEAFETGHAALGDARYIEIMRGVVRFAAERIPVTPLGPGVDVSAYTPFDHRQVVNANAYRAFLLNAGGRRFEREDWLVAGRRNVAYVLQSQLDDGSWPYSTDGPDDFVDNFHTCFVLKNLFKIWNLTRDEEVREAIEAGYRFYLDQLLDETGRPIPFARRPRLTLHRRDLYDYAEGINLAHLIQDEIPAARGVLESLVRDLIKRWMLPDGHFVTRETVVGRNTIPYHRWAQSQTFHALARVAAGSEPSVGSAASITTGPASSSASGE
jgi:hypothetical protein